MKNILRVTFGVLFVFSIYLLPTGAAMLRRSPGAGWTAVVNVLFGLTIVGWIVALAMAFRSPEPVATAPRPRYNGPLSGPPGPGRTQKSKFEQPLS
jgi:hypothetical protein